MTLFLLTTVSVVHKILLGFHGGKEFHPLANTVEAYNWSCNAKKKEDKMFLYRLCGVIQVCV